MSYAYIPRFATSWACRFDLRVYLFENAVKRRGYQAKYAKRNPSQMAEKWERYAKRHPRSFVSIESALTSIELDMVFATEQKSPLELLMEKEEAGLCC